MGFALSDMQVTSSGFETLSRMPARYAVEGDNLSPPLAWSGAPEGTQAFAVMCHDPDAPLVKPGVYGFVHWVLYNLPGSINGLEEGTGEGTTGVTDFGSTGYGGPNPPEGHGPHLYYFWVLALDQSLGLEPELTLWQFLEKAEPHILGMNRIVGVYER